MTIDKCFRTGRRSGLGLLLAASLAGMATACATSEHPFHGGHPMMAAPHAHDNGEAPPIPSTPALKLDRISSLEEILPALEDRRVVHVGETHDQYAHHLTQLEIIRHLHKTHPRLTIGVEFFQQPFQSHLDDYVAGRLDEREMLRATEYFTRWGYDYRLYAPIMRYARDNGLRVLALNVSSELVAKVREHGLDGLDKEDRAALPDEIDRTMTAYAERLRSVYEQHPHGEGRTFEHFLEGQLIWDEGMAQTAADYLRDHPDHRMVVLAGSGHLAYGDGIPRRLQRRVPATSAIVINGWRGPLTPDVGDYLLMPEERSLPPAGRIGAMVESDEEGLKVTSCIEESACETAGLKPGERLLSIEGMMISDMGDLRVAMWDRSPGDIVTVTTRRDRRLLGSEERSYEMRLR